MLQPVSACYTEVSNTNILALMNLALWFYPSLLAGSALWMLVWDTNVIQNIFLRRRPSKQPDETEDDSKQPTTVAKEDQASINGDPELGHIELRELELDAVIPYKVSTGLLVFAFFLVSFVTIVAIRGVIKDLPALFKFFSNVYLAGTIICGIVPSLLSNSS